MLDTLGVSIAATTLAREAKVLADYIEELGGKRLATVWVFRHKAPPPWAAFVNGSLGTLWITTTSAITASDQGFEERR